MRIVFYGTPDYILPILEMLHKTFRSHDKKSCIVAVVTQKPKIVGRDKKLTYSPVDNWAHKKGIKILRDLDNKEIPNADVGVLASYGEIIPNKILERFPFGIVNVHPSLLPKYRGASPVPAAIVSGEQQTGVTFIKLDEKLDHGPIISQFKEDIVPEDTSETLRNRLFERSAEVLKTLLPAYLQGKIKITPQDDKQATYTKQMTKEDGYIPSIYLNAVLKGKSFKGKWKTAFIDTKNQQQTNNQINPIKVNNFIRAMQPWPIAWTNVRLGQSEKDKEYRRLKILKAHLEQTQNEIVAISKKIKAKKKLKMTAADTEKDLIASNLSLIPELVQLEGKVPVTWKQFIEGYPEAII